MTEADSARVVQDKLIRAEQIEQAATALFNAVWHGIQNGTVADRSEMDDAALRLRDALNPEWPNNPN